MLDWMRGNIWTTRAGVTMAPAEMSEAHIRNTMALLERRAPTLYAGYHAEFTNFPGPPNGEMAEMYWEQEMMGWGAGDPVAWMQGSPLYRAFVAELLRREYGEDLVSDGTAAIHGERDYHGI